MSNSSAISTGIDMSVAGVRCVDFSGHNTEYIGRAHDHASVNARRLFISSSASLALPSDRSTGIK